MIVCLNVMLLFGLANQNGVQRNPAARIDDRWHQLHLTMTDMGQEAQPSRPGSLLVTLEVESAKLTDRLIDDGVDRTGQIQTAHFGPHWQLQIVTR